MRSLIDLNINEGGQPPKRPAVSDSDISDFENEFGVSFPDSLKDLLKFANGGHPELDSVGGSEGRFAVNRFYHLTGDDRGPESIWFAMKHWRSVLGEKVIVFANDGGGNQFFLDTSNCPQTVSICLHDEGMKVVPIASSFAEFIDSLEIDPDMI
jgi:cell wall assembly regulator SMI1